jgi:hypothetical protein
VEDRHRGWWETPACLIVVVLASCVPLLYPPIPPLVDLLGHMGRYTVALDLSHSAALQRYYEFHWAPIGNLGVDILVRALAPAMGVEAATKLVILAIPPLTVAGFLWVAREVHGRIPPAAYFAVPFAYGQPFLYGFVNFTLSMALTFLAFAYWQRLGRLGRTQLRAALFLPISLIVFFAHAFGWGVLGLMCFSAELVRQRERGLGWVRAGMNAALQVLSMASPLLLVILGRSGAQGPWAWAWFDWQAKLVWIESALRDRWAWFDVASVAVVVFVTVQAVRQNGWGMGREMAAAAPALIAVFLILPTTLLGSAYADMRLVPYIFALLLIGVRAPASPRHAGVLAALAIAFVAVRLSANTISLASAAKDQEAKIVAVAHVPVGARVASFVGMPCQGGWALLRNSHLGSLVTIRRQGFSNDQWLIEGAFGLGLKYRNAGYFAADPSQLVLPNGCNDGLHRTIDQALSTFPRDAFDYVWLIDSPGYDARLLGGLEPVSRSPGSELYRIKTL